MTCVQATENLGAWIDGELAAAEEREIRAHVAGCAACTAETDALRQVAGSARAWFRRSEGALPDLAGSRDRFIRTTLASGVLDAPAPWWRRPAALRLAAAAAVLVLAAAGVLFLSGGEDLRAAAYLRDAAVATLGGGGHLRIRVERPALLASGRRAPVILLGPGDRFLVGSEDVALMPRGFVVAGEIRRILRAPGRTIRFGSDGSSAWVHVEGEAEVKVFAAPPMPLLRMFREAVAEESGEHAGLPLLNWARVHDLLERARSGTVDCEIGPPEDSAGGRVRPVRVMLGSGDAAAAVRILVRERDLAIVRIDLGHFAFTFERPDPLPADSEFHWSSYAPADARVVEVR